jgi:DNA-binding NarL/FixJ family response regulator
MRDAGDPRPERDLRVIPGGDDGAASVIVVAAYPSLRAGLRALVEQSAGFSVVADAPDDQLDTPHAPDALVVDFDPDHLGLVNRLAARFPDTALLLLIDSPAQFPLLRIPDQATAILLKDASAAEIGAALAAILHGLVVLDPSIARETATASRPTPFPRLDDDPVEPLTERERQVLELVALGLPNKTIAAELGISEHTAKFHVGAIMSKLGAASRTEAVAIAARRGLLVL